MNRSERDVAIEAALRDAIEVLDMEGCESTAERLRRVLDLPALPVAPRDATERDEAMRVLAAAARAYISETDNRMLRRLWVPLCKAVNVAEAALAHPPAVKAAPSETVRDDYGHAGKLAAEREVEAAGDVGYENGHVAGQWLAMRAAARCSATLICAHCERAPATCIGAYESPVPVLPACDECCGHGCEDGQCEQIADMRALSAPPSAAPSERETLLSETLSSVAEALGIHVDALVECPSLARRPHLALVPPSPAQPSDASEREIRIAAYLDRFAAGDADPAQKRLAEALRCVRDLLSAPPNAFDPSRDALLRKVAEAVRDACARSLRLSAEAKHKIADETRDLGTHHSGGYTLAEVRRSRAEALDEERESIEKADLAAIVADVIARAGAK